MVKSRNLLAGILFVSLAFEAQATYFETGSELVEACGDYLKSPASSEFPVFNCWYDITMNAYMISLHQMLKGDSCIGDGLARLQARNRGDAKPPLTANNPSTFHIALIEVVVEQVRRCPNFQSTPTKSAIECALRKEFCS